MKLDDTIPDEDAAPPFEHSLPEVPILDADWLYSPEHMSSWIDDAHKTASDYIAGLDSIGFEFDLQAFAILGPQLLSYAKAILDAKTEKLVPAPSEGEHTDSSRESELSPSSESEASDGDRIEEQSDEDSSSDSDAENHLNRLLKKKQRQIEKAKLEIQEFKRLNKIKGSEEKQIRTIRREYEPMIQELEFKKRKFITKAGRVHKEIKQERLDADNLVAEAGAVQRDLE